jgi:hypothetical protein
VAVLAGEAASAFDLFTLWRQPMVPLQLVEGSWVDYQAVTLAGGRRSEDLLRVQCVGRRGEGVDGSWIVEMLPLREEADGSLAPVPGEGLRLRLSGRLASREGQLTDLVEEVVLWQDGEPRALNAEEWREDPLVSASFKEEFTPRSSELTGQTVRVVAGQELRCDQFELVAADTQAVELPRGRLEQISSREVTVALNARIPFLGIAFAAERTRAESRLDPPSERFPLPAPTTRIETMELVGFGGGARARLSPR